MRNDVVAVLDGEGIDCTLNGLYVGRGKQHIDNHTTIDHAQPHCGSHELYKGILGEQSRAVFNGKIIVRPDAQKTDAKQTNKALLLSDDAQINTKPQLEIFADDVKCTHGAAIGQLDDEAMFYLRSRGLGFDEARRAADSRVRRRHPEPDQDRRRCASTWKRLLTARLPTRTVRVMTDRSHDARHLPRARSRRFDVERVREDFPILSQTVHGKPLVYLDNAATTQKPQAVIDAMVRSYAEDNANIHRGVHLLSERATQAYEEAREKVQQFLNAARSARNHLRRAAPPRPSTSSRRPTAARNVGTGDEILITAMEHHSNIVPWQMLCEEKGAQLRVMPINDAASCGLDELRQAADRPHEDRRRRPRLERARHDQPDQRDHRAGARARRPGAGRRRAGRAAHAGRRAGARTATSTRSPATSCSARPASACSTARRALLEAMPPYQGGGDMISVGHVREDHLQRRCRTSSRPARRTSRAPSGSAPRSTTSTRIGIDAIAAYEARAAGATAPKRCRRFPGLRLIGTAREKASVLSFVIDGVHPHDIGTILDQEGIAVRTGHHCAQPLMERFGVPATARASLALYNTKEARHV